MTIVQEYLDLAPVPGSSVSCPTSLDSQYASMVTEASPSQSTTSCNSIQLIESPV